MPKAAMPDTDEIIIPFSRLKIALMMVGAIIFVLIGLWLFQMSDEEILAQRRWNNPALIHGIGLVCIAFFGLCAVLALAKAFDRKPGLVLNANGLLDNASAISAGLVPWAEVTGFGVYQVQHSRMLVIFVADMHKYAARGGVVRRRIDAMNIRLCGSPLVIPSSTLKIGFDELIGRCEEFWRKYGVAADTAPGNTGEPRPA